MTSENVYTEIVAERGAKVIPDLLRGNAGNVGEIGALLDIAADEIERLRATIDRLRAELTEAREPTCNACANFHSCWSRSWNNPSWARVFCPDGERFERVDPVRLYEIDAAMAGGAK